MRSKSEESQYLRESLQRTKDKLEQERRLNTNIKTKKVMSFLYSFVVNSFGVFFMRYALRWFVMKQDIEYKYLVDIHI